MTALWFTMIIAGVITYIIRLMFILLLEKVQISEQVKKGLNLVPPAVFSAIIFPDLFLKNGDLAISFMNGRLIAGLLAIITAWRTKNIVLTVIVGMVVLTVFQVLIQ
ncbi:MAG: AzlD domain-containing protein [Anaerolineales bacterium]|nr:AzlD domain-containing protein [Anaerolineales bacterium]